MNIPYKIIDLDESNMQIVVRPEGFGLIWIDLPIDDNGCIPEGESLDQYIQGFLPYYAVQRKAKLDAGIKNIDSIKAKVMYEPQLKNNEFINAPELSDEEKLENIIKDRNRRLLDSDWVELPSIKKMHDEVWIAAWDEYRQALRDMMQKNIDVNNPEFPIPPEL